ncbi:hypothetical protein JXR01_00560 [Candidatus Kaiserbacteria bacterium]|nr:MAG: hypothetical protein JXR01_00560 [Candidatus Kaiserbacteria bacterium]
MDFSKIIDIADMHHAYLLEDTEEMFNELQHHLRTINDTSEVYVRDFESLGIDDSRELIHLANMRSVGTQLFIFRARSCTREAQNALLKLFEEPPERTHFFLCVSSASDILPTLRSRVFTIESEAQEENNSSLGKDFLKATLGERISLLEPIVKEKDLKSAELLLNGVEYELYKNKAHVSYGAASKHVVEVRKVIKDKGASLKILMESVALVTPQLS